MSRSVFTSMPCSCGADKLVRTCEIDPCDMTVSPAEIRLGCYPEGGIRDGVRFRISRVSGEVLWERSAA